MFENTRCWVQVAVLLLLWLLLTIVASSLMFVVADFGVDIQSADNQLWLQFLSQIISFAGTALLFAWFFYGSAFDYFHLKASSKQWGRAGVAVFIMLLMLPVIDWITVWNDAWHFPASLAGIENMLRSITAQSEQLLEGLLMRADLPHLVLNIIVIALCPALCEELFFRGALQQVLHRWFGNPHWAIILTAVIFSLAHGEIFAFVPRFLLGVVLGYLFYLSGSLWVNVCAHFINNALIVVLYYLYANGLLAVSPAEPMAIAWLPTLLITAAAALLFYTYFVKGRLSDR